MELIFKVGGGLSHGSGKEWRGGERSASVDEVGGPRNGEGEMLERIQRV